MTSSLIEGIEDEDIMGALSVAAICAALVIFGCLVL